MLLATEDSVALAMGGSVFIGDVDDDDEDGKVIRGRRG